MPNLFFHFSSYFQIRIWSLIIYHFLVWNPNCNDYMKNYIELGSIFTFPGTNTLRFKEIIKILLKYISVYNVQWTFRLPTWHFGCLTLPFPFWIIKMILLKFPLSPPMKQGNDPKLSIPKLCFKKPLIVTLFLFSVIGLEMYKILFWQLKPKNSNGGFLRKVSLLLRRRHQRKDSFSLLWCSPLSVHRTLSLSENCLQSEQSEKWGSW